MLHRRAYRDTSLLIDLLTREHGRVSVIARGARGAKKKAAIEPLQPYAARWLEGRSDLGTLTGAEPLPRGPALHGEAMLCGLYCSELVLRLTARDDPHPELYDVFASTLRELAQADLAVAGSTDAPLRAIELSLLGVAGMSFSLRADDTGAEIDAAARYAVDAERGLIRLTADSQAGASGRALAVLADGSLGPDTPAELRRELRLLLRDALRPLLGPRPVAAASMLRQLRALPTDAQAATRMTAPMQELTDD